MSKLCDVMAVIAVLLASCQWVTIDDVPEQCITIILTSQVDGVEFFILVFPILFETSQKLPHIRKRILVSNIWRESLFCTVCNAPLRTLLSAVYSALCERSWLIGDELERIWKEAVVDQSENDNEI